MHRLKPQKLLRVAHEAVADVEIRWREVAWGSAVVWIDYSSAVQVPLESTPSSAKG